MSTIEELLERKSSGSSLENQDYGHRGSATLTTWHSLSEKVGTNFADKRRSLGQYNLYTDSGHGVLSFFFFFSLSIQQSQISWTVCFPLIRAFPHLISMDNYGVYCFLTMDEMKQASPYI
jgi:hypothetical protein